MPANRKFGQNNAGTSGRICPVRCDDAPQPKSLVPVAEYGRVAHCATDGKGIGRAERPFVGPDAKVVLI